MTDGSQPPVCHVHRAVAAGNPHNGGSINPRRAKTPEQVLEDLLHSKDEAVRLRAADAFLRRQEREAACPTCHARTDEDGAREQAIHRMTYDQRVRVRALIAEVKGICKAAISQPLTWDGERQCHIDSPGAPVERHASPPISTDIDVTAEADVTAQEAPSQPVTPQVDPQRYGDVGLFVDQGVVTHALGDEHARAIVEGRITFEEAESLQQGLERKFKRMY